MFGGGEAIGFFSLDVSPSPWWSADGTPALYLAGMIVAPSARGRGVGSFIIDWCAAEAGQFLGQQPQESFDLLFLDADREQYLAWWPWIRHVLAPGGLLVVDNAESHAAEMKGFVAEVQATPGWRSLVVPIGNGEFVALKPVP